MVNRPLMRGVRLQEVPNIVVWLANFLYLILENCSLTRGGRNQRFDCIIKKKTCLSFKLEWSFYLATQHQIFQQRNPHWVQSSLQDDQQQSFSFGCSHQFHSLKCFPYRSTKVLHYFWWHFKNIITNNSKTEYWNLCTILYSKQQQ